jgi:hypothetical protein
MRLRSLLNSSTASTSKEALGKASLTQAVLAVGEAEGEEEAAAAAAAAAAAEEEEEEEGGEKEGGAATDLPGLLAAARAAAAAAASWLHSLRGALLTVTL